MLLRWFVMNPETRDNPVRLTVGVDEAGDRLDRALASWRGLSRAAVLRLLDAGACQHNGRVMRRKDKGRIMHTADVVALDEQYAGAEAPRADTAMVLDVIGQGQGWLAVNKPAGVPVRPHGLEETGTILNAMVARYPQIVGLGDGGLRSGVVHRLDNQTSGVLILATEMETWQRLRGAFAEHRMLKRYQVLVHGEPADIGESVKHLRVARHAPAHVEVLDKPAQGKETRECSLAWRVTERFTQGLSLIEVDLHTGFLHQIRAMMSRQGFPVLGDPQYGGGEMNGLVPRQMLHACSLVLDEIEVQAPLPDDFTQVLTTLREG